MRSKHRKQIDDETVANIMKQFHNRLEMVLKKRGYGGFASRHEILGILDEEKLEFTEAVHSEGIGRVKSELLDIAVADIWGAASIDAETVDW
tara:strand:+ start:441 stop:716 length:276 start_codon:yes stop_codon:yes gene_type:complete